MRGEMVLDKRPYSFIALYCAMTLGLAIALIIV